MGYAYDGYCYPVFQNVASNIDSLLTIGNGIIVHPVRVLNDAVGPYISISLRTVSGGAYSNLPPFILRPVLCDTPGPLASVPFDPALLDTATMSLLFSGGFMAVSIPVVFSIGVSAILNFIRGKHS